MEVQGAAEVVNAVSHPIVSVAHTAVQPANHVDAIPKEICAGGNPANATKATTTALLSRL
jgi:hypothetical protein